MLPCHVISWSYAGILDFISPRKQQRGRMPRMLNIRKVLRKRLPCTAIIAILHKLVALPEHALLI